MGEWEGQRSTRLRTLVGSSSRDLRPLLSPFFVQADTKTTPANAMKDLKIQKLVISASMTSLVIEREGTHELNIEGLTSPSLPFPSPLPPLPTHAPNSPPYHRHLSSLRQPTFRAAQTSPSESLVIVSPERPRCSSS